MQHTEGTSEMQADMIAAKLDRLLIGAQRKKRNTALDKFDGYYSDEIQSEEDEEEVGSDAGASDSEYLRNPPKKNEVSWDMLEKEVLRGAKFDNYDSKRAKKPDYVIPPRKPFYEKKEKNDHEDMWAQLRVLCPDDWEIGYPNYIPRSVQRYAHRYNELHPRIQWSIRMSATFRTMCVATGGTPAAKYSLELPVTKKTNL